MAESGAIISYLVDRYGGGRLIPPAGSARLLAIYLLVALRRRVGHDAAAAAAGIQPGRQWPGALAHQCGCAPHRRHGGRRIYRAESEAAPGLMESELKPAAWFAGNDFTACDVQMSFPLEAAAARAGLNSTRPNLMAFLGRIHARDAYKARWNAVARTNTRISESRFG